jgi:hypothetical protein
VLKTTGWGLFFGQFRIGIVGRKCEEVAVVRKE